MSDSEFARRDKVGADTSATNVPPQVPESEYARRLEKRQRQLAGVRVQHQRLWTYLGV
jgi:hypothetical protein